MLLDVIKPVTVRRCFRILLLYGVAEGIDLAMLRSLLIVELVWANIDAKFTRSIKYRAPFDIVVVQVEAPFDRALASRYRSLTPRGAKPNI